MCQRVTIFHEPRGTNTLSRCVMEQLWVSSNSNYLHLVQISHWHQWFQRNLKDAGNQDTASGSCCRNWNATLQRSLLSSSVIFSLLKMVRSSWVFLLFEEKLQRRVPLISGKAVGQLAVIQQMGNFAQQRKQIKPAIGPAQTRSSIHFNVQKFGKKNPTQKKL